MADKKVSLVIVDSVVENVVFTSAVVTEDEVGSVVVVGSEFWVDSATLALSEVGVPSDVMVGSGVLIRVVSIIEEESVVLVDISVVASSFDLFIVDSVFVGSS